MESRAKLLNAVKYIGATILSIGIVLFFIGFFGNDYTMLTSIGIGTIVGAVFIFLMGVFFVVTEEMLEKTYKGENVVPKLNK